MNIDMKLQGAHVKNLRVIESGQKLGSSSLKDTAIAEIGREISFDTEALNAFDIRGCQPHHYDLLVLSAAIEFADRKWKRPKSWVRNFHVTIPVVDLANWRRPLVINTLERVLKHLTCDLWQFNFVQAKSLSPIGSRQIHFDFGKNKALAIAYSDGLDSRAVSALCGDINEVLCIRVAKKRQRRKEGDSPFSQLPFEVKGHRGEESSFRSRGFQFAAVTAIASQLANVERIVVPESGQGALSPVLAPLYVTYPDYRNHPTFFRKMEQFIAAVLGHRVKFEQPRLWFTKGQTLREFLGLQGKTSKHLESTRSCWQKRRVVNVPGKKQCGLCAACLLRRLSLHAAGVNDAPNNYVVSNLGASDVIKALDSVSRKADRELMINYGSVGARHFQKLANMANWTDDDLRVHVSEISTALGADYKETLKNLRSLLATHAEEWHSFVAVQGRDSFLMSWTQGERYG
ncbi:7-cyano-7-deazaguanine synthase (queuosine biosynthesis) [Azospirillum oryzae]|uniref:7-cyano-7-deazaguanine synthase (Queuosine biosynthesis) n=1 Tax=Azospirillum oryzae TaxID=286727 RepID=A0A1X7EHJ3_9PROT|nr:7-cyano-7-deazaguanine synthase [Azospirillum oryzae]SMF34047.1 7-cyano-7-deazaguanine synthase (queuosine biosynthesis) [Azospirillum oryzae]